MFFNATKKHALYYFLVMITALLMACDHSEDFEELKDVGNSYLEVEPSLSVYFSNPVTIMSSTNNSTQFDDALIGYFCIVQVKNDLFYMYYSSFGKGDVLWDNEQHLCFAFSENCIDWKKEVPGGIEAPFSGTNVLFMKNVIEAQVFLVDDIVYPFRMVCNEYYDKRRNLVFLKSKDGIVFDESTKKVLSYDNDSQVSVIKRGDVLDLYIRGYSEIGRSIEVMTIDYDGKVVSAPKPFIDYPPMYQASASSIEGRLFFFPTVFDNWFGRDDSYSIICILKRNNKLFQVNCNISDCLGEDDKWVTFSPGLVSINDKYYLSYMSRRSSHDEKINLNEMESSYKLVNIVIKN